MPVNNGWIKLHRSMIDWEWIDQPITLWVFMKCLLQANFEDKKWHGIDIPRGSFVTSYENLSSKKAHVSVRQVRTALSRLKMTGELTIKSNNRYTLISVNNYCKYQNNDTQIDKPATNKRQTNDKQTTTTKELKNIRNLDTNVSNGSKSRNPFVEIVLSEFQSSFSFKPTDKKPRFVAHNFSKNIQAFLKVFNPEVTEARFTKVIQTYMDWLLTQDYANKIETLDLVRRKFSIWADPQVTSYQKGRNATTGK